MKKVRVGLYFDQELYKKLQHEAIDKGISVSKLIEEKLKKK
jgi:predicted HicB family RNase H-like nuclease